MREKVYNGTSNGKNEAANVLYCISWINHINKNKAIKKLINKLGLMPRERDINNLIKAAPCTIKSVAMPPIFSEL